MSLPNIQVDIVDRYGCTPAYFAARFGHVETAQVCRLKEELENQSDQTMRGVFGSGIRNRVLWYAV